MTQIEISQRKASRMLYEVGTWAGSLTAKDKTIAKYLVEELEKHIHQGISNRFSYGKKGEVE